MRIHPMLLAATVVAGMLIGASAANAASEGFANRDVHLRTCGSTRCARITTIPAGARVLVYYCTNWCELQYAGRRGFAYASYISVGYYRAPPPPQPPSIYWYFGRPYWDDRHHSWRDRRRWWYDDHWHTRPPGFVFQFGF